MLASHYDIVFSLVEALIQEEKNTGVTLTALHPGVTDTDFVHKAEAEGTVEYNETSLWFNGSGKG